MDTIIGALFTVSITIGLAGIATIGVTSSMDHEPTPTINANTIGYDADNDGDADHHLLRLAYVSHPTVLTIHFNDQQRAFHVSQDDEIPIPCPEQATWITGTANGELVLEHRITPCHANENGSAIAFDDESELSTDERDVLDPNDLTGFPWLVP